jgi:hypothetical protein
MTSVEASAGAPSGIVSEAVDGLQVRDKHLFPAHRQGREDRLGGAEIELVKQVRHIHPLVG